MESPLPCLENFWRLRNHRPPLSWRIFGGVPPVSPLGLLLALNHHQTHPEASLQPLLSSSGVELLTHLSHHYMTALIRCWPPAPNSSPSRWEAGKTRSQSTCSNPAWRQRSPPLHLLFAAALLTIILHNLSLRPPFWGGPCGDRVQAANPGEDIV